MVAHAQIFPGYAKYFLKEKDPVKKMAEKDKGKVLVHFLKDAMHQDWKNNQVVRSLVDRSIVVLKKQKDKHKLSGGAKKEFKHLKDKFHSKLKAFHVAQAAQAKEQVVQKPGELENLFLTKIAACPAAQQLYQQATAAQKAHHLAGKTLFPNIKVQVVTKGAIPFEANCDWFNGQLNVSQEGSQNLMLSYVIFELCNFKRQAQLNNVWERALKGEIRTADEYAKEFERVEHGSVAEHRQVIGSAIETSGWDESMDIYKHNCVDFEAQWQQLKDTPHANCYREDFKELSPNRRPISVFKA